MGDLALPSEVAKSLDAFVDSARTALSPDLASIVLFGSAAEGRLRATSDVNVILVLARFDPTRVDQVREGDLPVVDDRYGDRGAELLSLRDRRRHVGDVHIEDRPVAHRGAIVELAPKRDFGAVR